MFAGLKILVFLTCLVGPALFGYLLGSIPFGYIVGRIHGIDLTKEGSGSTGSTNVLRLVGKKAAAIVLVLDFLKGFLSVYLVSTLLRLFVFGGLNGVEIIGLVNFASVVSAIFCLVGHCKSVWIGFKGGKAVASGVGILWGLNWLVGLIVSVIWILTVVISRYSSLGAILAVSAAPFAMFFVTKSLILTGYCIIGTVYTLWKHKANIQRLIKGEEPKVGGQPQGGH